MKRYLIVRLAVALLCAITPALYHTMFFSIAAFALVGLISLGVAIPQLQLFGDFICRGSTSKKQVALTFDDGPDTRSTPRLLDLLLDEKVQVVFFGVGKYVEENPSLALRIVFENHLLENNSFEHGNWTNFYSTDRLERELTQAQVAIQKATSVTPKFFRPPVGLSNPNTFRAAKKLNLKVVGWTIRSFDTVTDDPKKIVKRIVAQLKPGAIILLHDGGIPVERLLATVKSLLDELRKLDYEVVRLDKLLK